MLAGLELTPAAPFGRVAATPDLAATRRPLRRAKRQPLIKGLSGPSAGPSCLCTAASVPARDRRLSKRLRLPSGLSWAAMNGLDGTIGFDGTRSRGVGHRDDSFLLAPAGSALSQWRQSTSPTRGRSAVRLTIASAQGERFRRPVRDCSFDRAATTSRSNSGRWSLLSGQPQPRDPDAPTRPLSARRVSRLPSGSTATSRPRGRLNG